MTILPVAAIRSEPAAWQAWWTRGVAAALLPFLAILAWTALVRLPFYGQWNLDEFFFAVMAEDWRHGGLPYVTAFDIKPPLLLLLDAAAQALFGNTYATFKGLEILAVAAGALVLYRMMRGHASARMALWAAALYPIYTLAFEGTSSLNMLLQLPLVIAAFSAMLDATSDDASEGERLRAVFLSGIAIGAAGMIKQTAIFEAFALGLALLVFVPRRRPRLLAAFALGAALPGLAFAAWYAWQGHLWEMIDAVVFLAMRRVNEAVIASYGERFAALLTTPGAALNSALRSNVLMFLWGGAALCLLRWQRIRAAVSLRLLVIAALWLGFAFAEVVSGRLLVDYYLLAIVPPLIILAGAFYCHGLDLWPDHANAVLAGLIVVAIAIFAFAERRTLFNFTKHRDEWSLVARLANTIATRAPGPDDRLLVLNRGVPLYFATGLRPPVPIFHPTHLMAVFTTPDPDPLGTALASRPRFIVLADPERRLQAELPERYAVAEAWLDAHYRHLATVNGVQDSMTLYELAR